MFTLSYPFWCDLVFEVFLTFDSAGHIRLFKRKPHTLGRNSLVNTRQGLSETKPYVTLRINQGRRDL